MKSEAMQRILVVDDNDENLYYLNALLSAAGYEVKVARNGAEALQSALAYPPALIVTDILMPVMDGFALCRIWRGEPRLSAIPFVFYTATYTDPKDKEFGLSIGADEFLVKPMEPDVMLQAVRNLLRQKESGTLPDRSTRSPEMNVFLREYNSALVRKLEDKLVQLEAANQKLADSEELVHAVLDNSPLPIMAADLEGRILLINAAFSATFGYSAAEATGRYCSELIVPSGADSVRELLLRRMSNSEASPQPSKRRRKDGTLIDVEIYVGPMKLRDKVSGSLAIYHDIAEQRKLEDELRHSQKMEAMGRLAGGIAHDFNNLLMLISGYLGQMTESGLSPEQRTSCKEAIAATKRAASLTRQLLAFSRKHREEFRVTDLNSVVSNMQEMLRSLVSERIRLDVALSTNPVPVLADVPQLEMVVMNLAINAQDAMPDGGLLTIKTGSKEDESKRFAVLTVSDTGRGMTPEIKGHIFEPFFTTKQAGKGTGLGLSTVLGIVQRAGGHIEVESEHNQGTQFRVYLPETVAAPERVTAAPSFVPPARGEETILLAEDEAGIRAMTRAYLEALGYHVIEAVNGSEAVKVAGEYEGSIDLVLTDIGMPIMRGDVAVDAIRERRAGIKALYISGGSQDQMANKDDVLYKPFEFPELGRRVRSVLDSNPATRTGD
jgi:two-component system cell cycle sensor histidine kinase/response regulator CckA